VRRRDVIAGLGGIAAAWPLTAFGQAYPNRLIKIVLPYTAGSPNDVIARLVADPLSARLGQPMVIDNRPGAGTAIGVRAVMAAEPDGYTLLFLSSTSAVASLINKSLAYDPVTDLVPVVSVASTASVLVIAPSVPATSVPELVAYAKAHPGQLNWGFGLGTAPHLVGVMFKREAGIDIVNIPYKGGAQAIPDLLGGRIQINIGTASTLLPLIRTGQLRALAVTSATRIPDLPDVPTMIEAGYPRVTNLIHFGLLGPARLPADAVARINRAVNESLKSPDLEASMAKVGFTPTGGTPQDYAALLSDELKKWAPIVKTPGFEME
jgi:tripartite-type tricarboxylate transporter receptor subunit TctC